jgi:hypothetical protein
MSALTEFFRHTATQPISIPLFFGLGGYIGAWVLYQQALRSGPEPRASAPSLLGQLVLIAHDLIFLVLFHRWLRESGNHWSLWLCELSLVAWVGYDLVMHYRLLRRWSQQGPSPLAGWQYALAWLALQVAVLVPLWRFFSWVDNPFLLIHFVLMLCLSTSRNVVLVSDMAQEPVADLGQAARAPEVGRALVLERGVAAWSPPQGGVLH